MEIKCSSCIRKLDRNEAMICSGCGSLLCPDCATLTGHMCENCYGSLNYFN